MSLPCNLCSLLRSAISYTYSEQHWGVPGALGLITSPLLPTLLVGDGHYTPYFRDFVALPRRAKHIWKAVSVQYGDLRIPPERLRKAAISIGFPQHTNEVRQLCMIMRPGAHQSACHRSVPDNKGVWRPSGKSTWSHVPDAKRRSRENRSG